MTVATNRELRERVICKGSMGLKSRFEFRVHASTINTRQRMVDRFGEDTNFAAGRLSPYHANE